MGVCETCLGRGIVYRAGRAGPCPAACQASRSTSARSRHELARQSARNALAVCWGKVARGEIDGESFNLELAVRGCLHTGFTVEQIAALYAIPRQVLRRAAEGQGQLL